MILSNRAMWAGLAAVLLATGVEAATVRVLPAPRELRFEAPNGAAKRAYAKGDVLVRAFVLGPKTARIREVATAQVNGTAVQIAPHETLVQGLVTDVSGTWLFGQQGQLRTAAPVTYCTYRARSAIELSPIVGKQSFERCLVDRNNDGKFDAMFIAGSETSEPRQIKPAEFSVEAPQPDPSNRIEVSFATFKGKRTIILQTEYFIRNKRRSDILHLLVDWGFGLFDYQGGPYQGGRCFYERPDETLAGRIHILGVPVTIAGTNRGQKTVEASVGSSVPATLFVIDGVQRWGPTGFQSCGDGPI